MRKGAVLVVLLAALGAAFAAGTWYQKRGSLNAAAPRVLYYQDSMHHRSDHPGPCRQCGMPTTAVHEGALPGAALAADEGTALRMPAAQQRALGVQVAAVEQAAHSQKLRLYGRVTADETRLFKINAGTDGFIRELSSVTTGSLVSKDQWLATVSAPEARQAMQAFLVAVDAHERARSASEHPGGVDLANAGVQQAADRLLAIGMSPVQIAEMRRTRLVPANIRISAPGSGVVLARDVSLGQKFDRGDELYRIADLRHVWIEAEAFGPEAEHVEPGMSAEIAVPGRSRRVTAIVSRAVLPEFDAATQSVKFRLDADNPGYLLRPDMFVDVHLSVSLPRALVVPASAVVDSGLKKHVFVAVGETGFEPRTITTGWSFDGQVAILSGLAPGERVVVSGTFLLDSDTRMRERPLAAGHGH